MEESNINLQDSDNLSADVIKKKIHTMIKIRRNIQENMEVSGTHSHTPLDFLDVAMPKVDGCCIALGFIISGVVPRSMERILTQLFNHS